MDGIKPTVTGQNEFHFRESSKVIVQQGTVEPRSFPWTISKKLFEKIARDSMF